MSMIRKWNKLRQKEGRKEGWEKGRAEGREKQEGRTKRERRKKKKQAIIIEEGTHVNFYTLQS